MFGCKIYSILPALLLVLLGSSFTAMAQISFAPHVYYPTGSWPEVVGIGDVNNDGLNDVVLGTSFYFDEENDFCVFVYIQDQSGNLKAPVKYHYPHVYSGIESLIISDVNNDHLTDIVISYSDSIGIFFQHNSGSMLPVETYYSGYPDAYDISCGDLNHDGLKDIVISHWGTSFISVMYQEPSSGYSIQTYPAPSGGYDQIEVGDINNDGLDDIVFMLGQSSYSIYIYRQDLSGNLNGYLAYESIYPFSGIAIGDLNNDGINDLALSSKDQNFDPLLTLLLQDTALGILQPSVYLGAYINNSKLRIEDLNCDGRNEIIMVHDGWSEMTVYEQNTVNNYSSYVSFQALTPQHCLPKGFCVGDINNDGRKDVVFATENSGLDVLINQSTNNMLAGKPDTPTGEILICNENSIASYGTYHPNADSISWHIIPPEAGNILASEEDSCKVSWNENWQGMAGIFAKAITNCGTAISDTLYVEITRRMPVLDLGKDTSVCAGENIVLNAGNGFTAYTWQDHSHNSTYTVSRSGTYTVEASHRCGIRYDTIVINEIELPYIELPADTILCTGNYVQLDVTLPGNYEYRWQDNTTNPVFMIYAAGTYTAQISDINHCSSIKSVRVHEMTVPALHWTPDTIICSNTFFTLDAANPGSTYHWNDGSSRPQITVSDSGTYAVTVTNLCGTAQASVIVDMEDCTSYLDVPSAFSPNGDGLNDILYAVGVNVDQLHFEIYNRWGQLVFESGSLSEGWDGTLRGKPLDAGVFIFTITARSTVDGHDLQKKGNVTLIH
jgi:gliding motility-associated-like protein